MEVVVPQNLIDTAKKAIDAVAAYGGGQYDQQGHDAVVAALNDLASYATTAAANVPAPTPTPPKHHGN